MFGITLAFTSIHNSETWRLTSVYGPCEDPARSLFIDWFRGHEIADDENWLFLGDFNFYRSLSNRNKPGGNLSDTFIFNDAIGHLGLVELQLKGRAYTWSNMQGDPLLEQLDWFFTSVNWTISYPSTEVVPLAKITSDHIPCRVSIGTNIPRSDVFRFENFWVEHEGFLDTESNCWQSTAQLNSAARTLSARFKSLRVALKKWSRNLSNLTLLINNCNTVISFLDTLEDSRNLFNTEYNLRRLMKRQLATLLHYKNLYWKKRFTVNRIKLGDECAKFFHGMATISFRRNSISQLLNDQGTWIQDHHGKAGLIWNSFERRMGISMNPVMLFDLTQFIEPTLGLEDLAAPFQTAEIDLVIKKMPLDKAPGPDGFNGLFLKKCWHIIKGSFYNLCAEFYSGTLSLECINTSYITLVPKVSNPETVNDFRPISLLNGSLKVLTKILADRLQLVILKLIHKNQYGFIRSCSI